jgi:hypothetical protein
MISLLLLKKGYRQGRFLLKDEIGDQINVSLSFAAYNKKKWNWIRLDIFFNLLLKILKNMASKNFKHYTVCFLS